MKGNPKMKKTLSLLLVCVLLVGCIFSLASCGKTLSGTYKADVVVGGTSYTFSGSKVTLTAEVLGFEKSFEGTAGSGNISSLGGYYKELRYFAMLLENPALPQIASLREGARSVELSLDAMDLAFGKQ